MNDTNMLSNVHISILALWYKDNFSFATPSLRDGEAAAFACSLYQENRRACRVENKNTGADLFSKDVGDVMRENLDRVEKAEFHKKVTPLEVRIMAISAEMNCVLSPGYITSLHSSDKEVRGKLDLINNLGFELAKLDKWRDAEEKIPWDSSISSTSFPLDDERLLESRDVFNEYNIVKDMKYSSKSLVKVTKSLATVFMQYSSFCRYSVDELVDGLKGRKTMKEDNRGMGNVSGR